jgi:hypothetical protein
VGLLFAALAFPNVNSDIYSYIASGRVAAVHHANPYTHLPSEFPGDPLLPYVSDQYSGNVPSKLPAWMLLNVALAWLGGDDTVTVVLLYRFVLAAFAIGCVALIALVLREAASQHAAAGVVAFGWNPILLVYGASKTDVVMVFSPFFPRCSSSGRAHCSPRPAAPFTASLLLAEGFGGRNSR